MNGETTLSRELALRIGLAARALPDTDAKCMFTVLTSALGSPLTPSKLAELDLHRLKNAFGNAVSGSVSKLNEAVLAPALAILKQSTEQAEQIKPVPQPYTEGEMPGSVRIACASADGVQVDGHFGTCAEFMIYQVAANTARLIDVRSAEVPEGLVVEDKNVYRAELIQDCQVLYIASVGGPAAAKIVRLGIHPMKLAEIDSIAAIIAQLQTVLAGTPPPWLAKAMGIETNQRVRYAQEAGG